MITAICEMQDQHVCIEEVRLIENNIEAVKFFIDEMSEYMGWYGYEVTFYDCEIPESYTEQDVYQWMDENKSKIIYED